MKQVIRKRVAILAGMALGLSGVVSGAIGVMARPAPAASTAAPVLHPVSGLAVVPLTVTTAHGPHVFKVEVAASPLEQERGLMFRKAMGADEGMIFPMDPPRRTAFWMRNTVMGLDIVFIGPDHTVLNVAERAVPLDETPLPSAGQVAGVLEINSGRAAQIGLRPGDKVVW